MSTVPIEVQRSFRKGRPNYPLAFKTEVAMAANKPGVSVASVALAHGLNANMVYRWRRDYRAGLFTADKSEPTLLPITVVPSNTTADISTVNETGKTRASAAAVPTPRPRSQGSSGFIEIELNSARIAVMAWMKNIMQAVKSEQSSHFRLDQARLVTVEN